MNIVVKFNQIRKCKGIIKLLFLSVGHYRANIHAGIKRTLRYEHFKEHLEIS